MRRLLIALALLPSAVLAQSDSDKANALILPMIQEIQPGRAGEILTACVLQSATPEELAALAAAPGPSAAVGNQINVILVRPAVMECLQAAAQG
jgi:hypothetical protein